MKTIARTLARTTVAAAVATSFMAATARPAFADNSECKEAQDQFKQTSEAVYKACLAYNKAKNKTVNCEKWAATATDIQDIIKSIAGVLGIGSKTFEYNGSVSGNVIGLTKRLWVNASPAVNNTTTVKITHRDGKGKLKVNICAATYDPNGNPTASLITSKVIEDSDTITVPSSAGKNISVELVGREATHSFAYDLKVSN